MQLVQISLKLCESGPFTADSRFGGGGGGGGVAGWFTLEVVVGSVEAGGYG